VTCREAETRRRAVKQKPLEKIEKLWILLLIALKRPLKENMIQVTGLSHFNKREY
jgi:hypothetical protein